MADGPSVSKKCRYQNRQSPDRTLVFNLTSVQARLYQAFAILQLGLDCNAHKSFTEAKCNYKKVGTGGTPYLIDFDDIFSKGIDLLFFNNRNICQYLLIKDSKDVEGFFYDFNLKSTGFRFLSTLWGPNNSQNKILDETWCHLYVRLRVIFN